MKKLILLVVAIAAIGFTSCEKCTTCTVTDDNGGLIFTQEVCGNKKAIEEFEETFKTNYEAYPDDNISCVSE